MSKKGGTSTHTSFFKGSKIRIIMNETTPVAVQDECWGGSERQPTLWVLVKMRRQGPKKKIYKNVCMAFPNAEALESYISTNSLPVLPEATFRASQGETAALIARASSKQYEKVS